jgi:metallo-beta-lactamase family protein
MIRMGITMRVKFLGAARQVTGSRYLLEIGDLRLLVDCGMFQERAYLGRNWEPSPIPPESIAYLLLTHAHVDHCGLIPKLVHEGFAGTVLATAATRDLAEIVLHDAAHIQAEDVVFKQKRHKREGRTGPYPLVPLYTPDDVESAMGLFQPVAYEEPRALNGQVSVTYRDGGHILGSAMLELSVRLDGQRRTVVFSGDIGEWNKPIIRDPTVFDQADYVVMESTYGDRDHEGVQAVEDQLCEVINETVHRGGNIVIPTFAIERAQELMYYLGRLVRQDRIPHLMVFLDSPMAVDATKVFRRHRECMDEDAVGLLRAGKPLLRFPGMKLIRETNDSKAINRIKGSCIIMAGSGMCTAGRIKHHLVNNIGRRESTILFAGYQAVGTLGRQIVEGNTRVRILGAEHPVKARVAQIHGLSGHAGRSSLLRWAGGLQSPPRILLVTHGEEDAANQLAESIRAKHGWRVEVPRYLDEFELD